MNSLTKTSFIYILLAVFSVIFNLVYGLFSHGITSESMSSIWIYLFLVSVFFIILNIIVSINSVLKKLVDLDFYSICLILV